MQPTLQPAGGVRLSDFLPRAQYFGGDIHVTSCTSDWSCCQPGDLFVALCEAEVDGHEFVRQAIERGATAVLAERPLAVPVPVCVVGDSRVAYGRLCQALARNPSERLCVVGVSGTNGKTVTSHLIASVLRATRADVGWTSSLTYSDSCRIEPAVQTTPSPPELAKWMARMVANRCSHAVLEVSSDALATRRIAGVQLDVAVMTNLRADHLDLHGSVLNYRAAKSRLFSHLKPGGFAVVNADDPGSKLLISKLEHPAITVGMHAPAEITARVVERCLSEQTFLLHAGNETVPVRTTAIGDHHVYDCLAAAATGLVLGIDLVTVVQGLEQLDPLAGRLERLACGQPFGVFVDAGGTPDTLASALKALRQASQGRVICVFGADASGDPAHRPLLGRVIERTAHIGILTNNNPRCEKPLQVVHDVLDGYERPAKAHVMPNRRRAIVWALEQARPGDAVLIGGQRGAMSTTAADSGMLCDDREIATAWLRNVGVKRAARLSARRTIPIRDYAN